MSTERDYPTDGSDEPWELLQELLPKPQWEPGGRGRPPVDRRRVLHGIFSLKKTGCQWRMIPKDCGHGRTVYGYCKRWRLAGLWSDLMKALRQKERIRQGRNPEPSAASLDSQSMKAATQEKEAIGFDGHKKVKGRQRPRVGDTLGWMMAVVVTAANVDERQGFKRLVEGYCAEGIKRRRKIWVDGGSQAGWLQEWVRGLKRTHKIEREMTDHEGKGFHVVPWRWAVERPLSWLLNERRHSRDYERLPANSEALIQISMIHLLLKRLA
jgi:putative transposase